MAKDSTKETTELVLVGCKADLKDKYFVIQERNYKRNGRKSQ